MLWGISEIVNVRASCHCVQHPWKLTGRDFWSSRNDRNPLSQQKCVLRKCCRESHKQWKLELSKHCHFAHHSWKLLVGISGALGTKENHPQSKMCFAEMLWSISEMVKARAFKALPFAHHPWKLTGRDFWSSRTKESHFLSKNVFWENVVGFLRNGDC